MTLKTLVTGASGFIGKNLVAKLRQTNHKLTCLIPPWEDFSFNDPAIEEIRADLREKDTPAKISKEKDIIFHLAARTDFEGRTFADYKSTNVIATESLAKAALKEKVKRFVFTSSITAVGLRYDTPFVKENIEARPASFYASSKLEAEKKLLRLQNEKNLPVVIIRPTTVYGPHEKSVFLSLCKTINEERYFQIGDGQNLVSYVYVENLIKALILAAEKEKIEGEIFTISDIYPYSMNQLTESVARNLGHKPKFLHLPTPIGYGLGAILEIIGVALNRKMPLYRSRVKNLCSSYTYDIEKAIKELGYLPDFNLEQGVRNTINWYKANGLL